MVAKIVDLLGLIIINSLFLGGSSITFKSLFCTIGEKLLAARIIMVTSSLAIYAFSIASFASSTKKASSFIILTKRSVVLNASSLDIVPSMSPAIIT